MKICLLYPHLPPAVDGVGEYTCHLARELASLGAEVTVVAGPGERCPCHVHPVPASVHLDRGITDWGVRGLSEIARRVRATDCDVVSLQYTPFSQGRGCLGMSASLLPHWLRARGHCRVTITLHEPWAPFTGKMLHWGPAAWQRLASGFMVSACDRVIVTSERRRRQIQRMLFPAGGRVAMVPVGSNIPVTPADRAATRERLGVGEDEILFAIFGTTHPQRNYEAAYRALAAVLADGTRCRLVNIGKVTSESRLRGLCRLESELGLEGRINWTGFCDTAVVSALLQAADLFLSPDRYGASTRQTSLMAALSHGLPVIAWRGSETDPLLERSGAIAFAAAGDEGALAAAMQAAAAAPEVRASMGARAKQLFEENFSWRRIAERTLKVYQRR